MQPVFEQIQGYIDAHRAPMLELWRELVDTESGVMCPEDVADVAAILRREMEEMGLKVRTVPMEQAGDVLIGEWDNGSAKAPMLFIGHMDTVFKHGTVSENPFRIDEEGYAHGPGVLDMKAGVVIALYAVRALMDAGYTDRPVKIVLAGDEENLHMRSNAREVLFQEVAGCYAAFNFETGYPNEHFVVGRNGGGIVEIAVHGVSAHSGLAPEKGRSAIVEASHKIIEIESQTDIPRGRLMNCGIVSGGLGENTVPDSCKIRVGIRFPSTQVKDEIMEILQKAADHSTVPDTWAELKVDMFMDCMDDTPDVYALFEHVKQTAADCGYGAIECFRVGSVSDSGITVTAGVPTLCGMGARGTGNHTPNEVAQVESLYERCVLAACAVYALKDGLFTGTEK